MIFADGHEHNIFFKQNGGSIFLMFKRVRLVLSGTWCVSEHSIEALIFSLKSFGIVLAWPTRRVELEAHTALTALRLLARRTRLT